MHIVSHYQYMVGAISAIYTELQIHRSGVGSLFGRFITPCTCQREHWIECHHLLLLLFKDNMSLH